MKTALQLVLISMMMIFANPAWSGSAVAVYTCEQNETASEADVMAAANAWLEAAKGMKGGENLEVRVMFPMAVTMGESDFLFVVLAPTFGLDQTDRPLVPPLSPPLPAPGSQRSARKFHSDGCTY